MTAAEFEQQMRQQGFEVVHVERQAGSMDLHTHPFEACAFVLEGEITIISADKTQHCRVGETFQLDANIPHSEIYGDGGVRYIAARKHQ